MKILFMGDASAYHATLARQLVKNGHDVTVASNGSRWMDTTRNIDISRRQGKIGGALLWLKLSTVLASRLKGYDIVQLVNPMFVELKPNRTEKLFKRLKRDNGHVCLTALGTDSLFIDGCRASDSPLKYSEWAIEGRETDFSRSERGRHLAKWLDEPLKSYTDRVYSSVDGIITALYEYHIVLERFFDSEKIAYGGIPIDTDSLPFLPPTAGENIRVLAPFHEGRQGEKGTDILARFAAQVPGVKVEPVTGLRYADFIHRLENADIVLDQLYSYTPATTALMAMAMGKTVVTGGELDFAKWIGELSVPVVNPDPRCPERLVADLARAIEPENLRTTATEARAFVEKHNDISNVARRCEDFWNRH